MLCIRWMKAGNIAGRFSRTDSIVLWALTYIWGWIYCRSVDFDEPWGFFLTVACDSLFDKALIAWDCTVFLSFGIVADSFSKSSPANAVVRMNWGCLLGRLALEYCFFGSRTWAVQSSCNRMNWGIKGSSVPACAAKVSYVFRLTSFSNPDFSFQ